MGQYLHSEFPQYSSELFLTQNVQWKSHADWAVLGQVPPPQPEPNVDPAFLVERKGDSTPAARPKSALPPGVPTGPSLRGGERRPLPSQAEARSNHLKGRLSPPPGTGYASGAIGR